MTDFRDRMIAVRTIVYFWMQRRRKQPCFQDAVNPSFRAAKLKSLSEIQRVSGGGIHTGNWPGRDPVSCARRAFWGLPFNRFWPEAFPGRNWIARLASAGKAGPVLSNRLSANCRCPLSHGADQAPGALQPVARRVGADLPGLFGGSIEHSSSRHRFAFWPEALRPFGIRGGSLPRREHALMLCSAGASSCPDAAKQDAPATSAGQCPRRSHFVPETPVYPPAFHKCSCFVRISVDSRGQSCQQDHGRLFPCRKQ